MKIYTKTGDTGETSLYGGMRRPKDDARIEAYGAVDELQAHLGVAIAHLPSYGTDDIRETLQRVQKDGFVLCAELARMERKVGRGDPELSDLDLAYLEEQIDGYELELPPLQAFIVQGGSLAGASLHVARAVCRRAERRVVSLKKNEPVRPLLVQYLNRLSDLLFVVARVVNHRAGQPEIEWHPN